MKAVLLVLCRTWSSEVIWEFESDLESWASASWSEMKMEVRQASGALRGSLHGHGPAHIDSPNFELFAYGRQSVALRLKYQSSTRRSAWLRARYGTRADEFPDHSTTDWSIRDLPKALNASEVVDGNISTYTTASELIFLSSTPRVVTEIEIAAGERGTSPRGFKGGPPAAVSLDCSQTIHGPWRRILQDAPVNTTEPLALTISERVQASYWRLVVHNATEEARIAEVRLLPAVVEMRFEISPTPEYRTYVVPIWRRARSAHLAWSRKSAIKLTRLRLYVGDSVIGPDGELRDFDASSTEACAAWGDFDSPTWASPKWRLVTNYYRTTPWIIRGIRFYEDATCAGTPLDEAYIDSSDGDATSGYISSRSDIFVPESLHDGRCNEETGWMSSTTDDDPYLAWLGVVFKRRMSVRCIMICQGTFDGRGRAESVNLQRHDGTEWIDHSTLSLAKSAAAVSAVCDPCNLKYKAPSSSRVQRAAYDRSALSLRAGGFPTDGSALASGDAFDLDWVRITRPPIIRRVTGCVDRFWPNQVDDLAAERITLGPLRNAVTALADAFAVENGFLRRHFAQVDGSMETQNAAYATTLNCPRDGGLRLEIRGEHILSADFVVTIEGEVCGDIRYENNVLTCELPVASSDVTHVSAEVKVARADVPELYDAVPYLSYMGRPPKLDAPTMSNLAAQSIDLSWRPPPSLWDAVCVTGYIVTWRLVNDLPPGAAIYSRQHDDAIAAGEGGDITLGNVTTTTVIGLEPQRTYSFSVAAVVEDRWTDAAAVDTVDLYGRRPLLNGALVGPRSVFTNLAATLRYDVHVPYFDANATLDHGAANPRNTLGPTGVNGGEGHYGMKVVGSAHVENCNESSTCRDYDENTLICMYCSQHGQRVERDNLSQSMLSCGPALRLTSGAPLQAGAAWYGRRLNVREGFDTTFVLRMSNPSVRCNLMDEVYTRCRSRGADGTAFVIQEASIDALGARGSGLGYDNISNSLAVEFDTYFNHELLDPYENHVSVHSNGFRSRNSAHHQASFASTSQIADLTGGAYGESVPVRITYNPVFDSALLETQAFQTTQHTAHFFTNAEFPFGGMCDFGIGIGTLAVYAFDLVTPILVIPINLDALLELHHGRAFVGFTAATGTQTWQVHDVLEWSFTSLRQDPLHVPPPLLDARDSAVSTAFSCVSNNCTHP